jgi:hypothetical protein
MAPIQNLIETQIDPYQDGPKTTTRRKSDRLQSRDVRNLVMDQKTKTATTNAVRVNLTIGARRGRAARGRPATL